MIPYHAGILQVPALAQILWHPVGDEARRRWMDRISDLWILLRAARRGALRAVRDQQGTVGFSLRDGERLHALYVLPRGHRRGVGRSLVRHAQSVSPRLELWCLQSNPAARAFYQTMGFSVTRFARGEGNDEGLPDLMMVWQKECTR